MVSLTSNLRVLSRLYQLFNIITTTSEASPQLVQVERVILKVKGNIQKACTLEPNGRRGLNKQNLAVKRSIESLGEGKAMMKICEFRMKNQF